MPSTRESQPSVAHYREAYVAEASEMLAELEGALLELEQNPRQVELIDRAFRSLHTVKGSGAMVGFDNIARFAHELETVFDRIRTGRMLVTSELIGITLDARDHMAALLTDRDNHSGLDSAANAILERLRKIDIPSPPNETEAKANLATQFRRPEFDTAKPAMDYRIRFAPDRDLLLDGTNPILLLKEIEGLGESAVCAHRDRIPDLADLDTESCYTSWDVVLTTTADDNAIRDVFVFVEDRSTVTVDRLIPTSGDRPRLGEILIERGDAAPEDIEKCLEQRPLTGEMLVQAGLVPQEKVNAALLEQEHLDKIRSRRPQAEPAAAVRVPAVKLDSMVDVVGELVTMQARLTGYAMSRGDSEVRIIAEEIERLTEVLRQTTMSMRMLPIGETFSRFKRLVRDLSSSLGKKAELTVEGTETELDKTVIQQLGDPLVHLIRNAIDHGIEPPEIRTRQGKGACGRIHLSACHSGAFVLIRVEDDGAGMHRDAIYARAVERGMIRADEELRDEQIYALTLAPGFSTAAQVTEVSGRGVGMDVVQRSIDQLRGTLFIESTKGSGTTVTLKIPLTLAIIDGLLVETGTENFVVPLSNIRECIELSRNGRTVEGRHSLVNVRGDLIPYISLRDRFSIPGEPEAIEQVIIAETREGKFGFLVDRVIGDHQTVIKKLGSFYQQVEEISGATILGNGKVALVLDIEKIAVNAIRQTGVETYTRGLRRAG
jgi:two-component system chemotaxis sensor kinase CheA